MFGLIRNNTEKRRNFSSQVWMSGDGSVNKTTESYIVNGKRVFSVRLGNFRSTNNQDVVVERGEGESSSVNLDVRRCYSMGSFQYIVADSDLRQHSLALDLSQLPLPVSTLDITTFLTQRALVIWKIRVYKKILKLHIWNR